MLWRMVMVSSPIRTSFTTSLTIRWRSVILSVSAAPVRDDTGLKGSWNFTLSFTSLSRLQGGGTAALTSPADGTSAISDPYGAVSLFDAIRSQVGLKLEKEKRFAPVLVIDHIEEQPTPN
jgi:uncharacterized protein (TIGR03435 family)